MSNYEGLYNQISLQSATTGKVISVARQDRKMTMVQRVILFLSKIKARRASRDDGDPAGTSRISRGNKSRDWKRLGKYVGIVAIVVAIVLGSRALVKNISFGGEESGVEKTQVKGAKATQELGKEFKFPLRDADGEEVERVSFVLERAELRDEIIVKGQKATAVEGREFLIITIKLTNPYKDAIEIDSKDYVRLSVNGNKDEWLAPDIHNDPVEVQAISTKYTRLGFPINEDDGSLVLRVGEIDGEKQEVELNLE